MMPLYCKKCDTIMTIRESNVWVCKCAESDVGNSTYVDIKDSVAESADIQTILRD